MDLISAQERDGIDFLLQEEGLEPYRMRFTAPEEHEVVWAPLPWSRPCGPARCCSGSHLPNPSRPVLPFEVSHIPLQVVTGVLKVRQSPRPAGDPSLRTQ